VPDFPPVFKAPVRDLFEELKRRNVVRVGAAYTVVAWILLQVVDTVAPLMAMPEWVPGFVLILMGVGFPIALVFAWAYEITPDGLKKTEEVDATASVTASTGRKIDRMIIGGLALVVVFLVADRVLGFTGGDRPESRSSSSAENASIAVLPFVNLSSDPEQEFFSDGISEELLNVLAQVPDLRVAARTSSFQFKGDNRDITEIAQTLNVRHVLEGSVRKDGSTVRITAQLIDASDGFHLWSETFDRDIQNVFAVQDEISTAIVDALREQLGLVVVPVVRDVSTTSTEAHEAYLRGRHLVVQRTRATIEAATAEFERAVELDPDYALAHAELSLAWNLLARDQYGDLTNPEVLERSEPHAFEAVALAEGLAEAQAARGFVEWQRGEFGQALAAFAAALDINPNYSSVHAWTGNILDDDLGRYAESSTYTQRAAQLDPLSIPAVANIARDLFEQGRAAEAEVALQKLAPLSPAFPAHIRGEALSRRGDWADGLRLQLQSLAIDPTSSRTRRFMSFDFIRLGLFEEAEAIDPELSPFLLSAAGDHARELQWVEDQVARDPESPFPESARGMALAGAGDFERAKPVLEESWRRSGQNVTRLGLFTTTHALALAVARREVGQDIADLVRATADHDQQYLDAGITTPNSIFDRGLSAWLAGDRERALDLMFTGTDEGAILIFDLAFLDDLYSDPGFARIRERYRARQATERADFLASVCTDNPWADVWTPLEGTCAGA
jgi:TolB-like protein/Tfp pilus assembly protein PilF